MRRTFLVGIVATLAALSPVSHAQQTAFRWKAVNPSIYENGQASPWFVRDLRDGWRNDAASEIFWVRLAKSGDSFDVRQVSPTPIARTDISEEVLVVDAARHLVHPAYMSLPGERAPRSGVPCEPEMTANVQQYTLCNSAFGATTSAPARLLIGILSGGQTEVARSKLNAEPRSFDIDLLAAVVRGPTFSQAMDSELPAAHTKQQELIAALQKQRLLAQAEDSSRSQAQAAEAQQRALAEKVEAIARLKTIRRGFKDVCTYLRRSLSRGANLASEPLQCINLGAVQSMDALKAAGFIITAVQGTASDPSFNLEKFD
jgi:hypothetical protein